MATTNTISSDHSTTPTSTTPLGAVLALTFLGSLGTGIVTNGIAFVATQGLDYSKGMNLLLTLALGLLCRYGHHLPYLDSSIIG